MLARLAFRDFQRKRHKNSRRPPRGSSPRDHARYRRNLSAGGYHSYLSAHPRAWTGAWSSCHESQDWSRYFSHCQPGLPLLHSLSDVRIGGEELRGTWGQEQHLDYIRGGCSRGVGSLYVGICQM